MEFWWFVILHSPLPPLQGKVPSKVGQFLGVILKFRPLRGVAQFVHFAHNPTRIGFGTLVAGEGTLAIVRFAMGC